MADKENKQSQTFQIPQNFAESGVITVLGMPMKTRNLAEAGIVLFAIGYPLLKSTLSLTVKIWLITIFGLTPAIFCLFGIGGVSFSQFLIMFFKFLRNKRVVKNHFEERQEKADLIKERNDEFDKKSEEVFVEPDAEVKPKSKMEQMFPGLALMRSKSSSVSDMSSFIPIKAIKNGIVYTTDGRFIKILEVTPINLDMMSPREQENTIYNFMSYLKIAPANIQLKVLTKKADVSSHIKVINEELLTKQTKK